MKQKQPKPFYAHLNEIGFSTKFEIGKYVGATCPLHYIKIVSTNYTSSINSSEYQMLQEAFNTQGNLLGWMTSVFTIPQSAFYEACLATYEKNRLEKSIKQQPITTKKVRL
ncbi:MAG TPA: hypothetical protein VM577_09400 [Anaerovoracaceae bacterium]|nr:hypothetical protein [Anaerovoracaceae bacterium]